LTWCVVFSGERDRCQERFQTKNRGLA